jgi:protein disulfide-isomerase
MRNKPAHRRKQFALPALLTFALVLAGSLPAAEWLTDLPSAQEMAKAQNKLVLLDFTGSDWCHWCIRLKSEIFSQPEFEAFAEQNLVLVEVDFPRRKAQNAELKQANARLSRQFQITGYPTVIVLDADGKQLGTLGYQAGGPNPFIASLARLSGRKPAVATATAPASEVRHKEPESPPLPVFNGAPMLRPQIFTNVVLKGISGPKGNRLAVINNETLGAGESAMLKLGNAQVKVKCIEVREDSVLVSLDGSAPREVRMRGGL